MTAALARARALLDTPPTPPVPGQLTTDHQEQHMTETPARVLALMSLMRDIEKPSGVYNRAVRRAAQTLTDSPENEAAQARGNAALLEIEQAVRAWVAKYPDPEQAKPEPPFTASERQFLAFAMDLAFDRMVNRDGFDDEDHAALARFRRLAEQPTP
ncbi:hypothetical protein [[Kitasatospora] papulosa]|uniref:hypothetical protein n=1 Tax=[Kitasatospora] papulosa TaxID=1464011 RepID=UPI0037F5FE04